MLYILRQRLKAQKIDVDKTIQGEIFYILMSWKIFHMYFFLHVHIICLINDSVGTKFSVIMHYLLSDTILDFQLLICSYTL